MHTFIYLYFYVSMLQCIFSRFSIFYVSMFLGFYYSMLIFSDISMLLCSYFSMFLFFVPVLSGLETSALFVFPSHKIIA